MFCYARFLTVAQLVDAYASCVHERVFATAVLVCTNFVCRHLDHLQIVCLCLNNKNRLSVMVGFDVGALVCNSALFPKIKVSAFGSYSTVEPT